MLNSHALERKAKISMKSNIPLFEKPTELLMTQEENEVSMETQTFKMVA